MSTMAVKATLSMPEQAPIHGFQRFVLMFHRRTWRNFARISVVLFVLLFIAFLSFYFRIYVPSFKEKSFENLINCTVVDVKNNNRMCKKENTGKICQLITGLCSDGKNRTLYATWRDNEESSSICSLDPCLTSSLTAYSLNQTFYPVYQSSLFDFGYLTRTARMNFLPARIIFYVLIAFIVILSVMTIVLLWILHNHQNYIQIVSPVSVSSVNPSLYRHPPSIIIQKASKSNPKEELQSQPSATSSNTLSTSNSLSVPTENPNQQPLDPTSLPQGNV